MVTISLRSNTADKDPISRAYPRVICEMEKICLEYKTILPVVPLFSSLPFYFPHPLPLFALATSLALSLNFNYKSH